MTSGSVTADEEVPLLAFRDAPGKVEEETPEQVLADAEAAFRRGAVDAAQARFRHAFSLLARLRPTTALAQALRNGDLDEARARLEARLAEAPDDALTLMTAAEFHRRAKEPRLAQRYSARLVDRLPGFLAARVHYVRDLVAGRRMEDAFRELAFLERLGQDPEQLGSLRATALTLAGRHVDAIEVFEDLPDRARSRGDVLLQYGNALRYGGRAADSAAVYRRAAARRSGFGAAWWSLANIKTAALDGEDVAAMERLLEGANREERLHLHFALGTAREQAGEYDRAFEHYARGNALRAETLSYDPGDVTAAVDAWQALLDSPTVASDRYRSRDDAPVPIFVLGLPRVGSTLVEQILASHSQVEATRELPCLPRVARLCADGAAGVPGLVAALAKLSARDLQGLGESYLALAARERRTERVVSRQVV